MEQERDEKLWRIARKRAEFRKSLYSYIIVNSFLWLVWWFTGGSTGFWGTPWPIWVMLGWGVGLGMQYYEAYHSDSSNMAEREYEKLKQQNRQP